MNSNQLLLVFLVLIIFINIYLTNLKQSSTSNQSLIDRATKKFSEQKAQEQTEPNQEQTEPNQEQTESTQEETQEDKIEQNKQGILYQFFDWLDNLFS